MSEKQNEGFELEEVEVWSIRFTPEAARSLADATRELFLTPRDGATFDEIARHALKFPTRPTSDDHSDLFELLSNIETDWGSVADELWDDLQLYPVAVDGSLCHTHPAGFSKNPIIGRAALPDQDADNKSESLN
jgi:hypothetical protein